MLWSAGATGGFRVFGRAECTVAGKVKEVCKAPGLGGFRGWRGEVNGREFCGIVDMLSEGSARGRSDILLD